MEQQFLLAIAGLSHSEECGSRRRGERRLARQHLIEDAAQGIDVAAAIDVFRTASLLGRHVRRRASARTGPVVEGAVGGGTGMGCNGFEGGIGTSSRVVQVDSATGFTLGVLVQCNYGGDLHIVGAPVGREITDLRICTTLEGPLSRPWTRGMRRCDGGGGGDGQPADEPLGRGSVIVVVATDAPFLPHQLERIARRVGMGLGRLGSWAGNGSGDLFLAFSTANREDSRAAGRWIDADLGIFG